MAKKGKENKSKSSYPLVLGITKFPASQCTGFSLSVQFSSVQSLSRVQLFATPWIAACNVAIVHHQLPEFTQTHAHRVGDAIQPSSMQCCNCPSPTPRVYSNSCPSSWWCHPAISSSVIPFSSCPQSLPASGSFQMSQLFAWRGQSTGVSALASVLPVNTQDWSPLGWTGWISLQSRDPQESSPTPQFKSINSSVLSFLYSPTLTSTHDHWKNHSLD